MDEKHARELLRTEQSARLGDQRAVQRDDVTAFQQLVECNAICAAGLPRARRDQDLHIECRRDASNRWLRTAEHTMTNFLARSG